MDRGVWWATVHVVSKGQTRLRCRSMLNAPRSPGEHSLRAPSAESSDKGAASSSSGFRCLSPLTQGWALETLRRLCCELSGATALVSHKGPSPAPSCGAPAGSRCCKNRGTQEWNGRWSGHRAPCFCVQLTCDMMLAPGGSRR